MKLHVGCGAVYLRGWLNIDIPSPTVFLASERPDLAEKWMTDESDYYRNHRHKDITTWRQGPITQDTACDAYGSFGFLPVRAGSVAEILCRQAWEHLDRAESVQAVRNCWAALRHGGFLRIDVPDPDETLRKYRETGDEFYIRHLFGPRRDEYGFHRHHTRQTLRELVESSGEFRFMSEEENIHDYPAFTLRFKCA